MKSCILIMGFVLPLHFAIAQTIQQKLQNATDDLLKDEQLKHAVLSIYVTETNTGKTVFHLNEQIGLAPGSTQKIFTSIAAFDLLGEDYHYTTTIGYDGNIRAGILNGNVYLTGTGDPTFASSRFASTGQDQLEQRIMEAVNKAGIKAIHGNIILDNSRFSYQPLPGGWIWDDIGNYYGAGTWALNWDENQYDLTLGPAETEGGPVSIIDTSIALHSISFINLLKTARKESGDNGYIYFPPYSDKAFVTGTEAAGESRVTISGAIPDPSMQIKDFFNNILKKNRIEFNGNIEVMNEHNRRPYDTKRLTVISSPSFDSINYWFLQKSINLYGEALIKTIAYEKNGLGSTDKGVEILRNFWHEHGIEKSALNLVDGSGLSPQNRVTTEALVQALNYARTREWYDRFYSAIPVYNGIKMKSGTIGGAKSFAGYQTAKNGNAYTFAIIINNFDESAGSIVPKLYRVLNVLK